jgi:hypothetical protein
VSKRGSFTGVKRPDSEAVHSPPCNAEVKSEWSYTSTPKYAFMACCTVKKEKTQGFYFYLNFSTKFLLPSFAPLPLNTLIYYPYHCPRFGCHFLGDQGSLFMKMRRVLFQPWTFRAFTQPETKISVVELKLLHRMYIMSYFWGNGNDPLLTSILSHGSQVTGSCIGRINSCSTWGFSWFCSVSP